MGLLGNILSNAVSNGIGKGISNAVGKAVEGAVRPAADQWANQAAQSLNQATQAMNESSAQLQQAAQDAAQTAQTADAQSGSGTADLDAALGNLANLMQTAAASTSTGATQTAAQNERNTDWEGVLPQYPKWTLGGDWELDVRPDHVHNGHGVVYLLVHGGTEEQLEKMLQNYVGLLLDAGFQKVYYPEYKSYSDDLYYKIVDGVCRTFDKTDANQGDFLSMAFLVGDPQTHR